MTFRLTALIGPNSAPLIEAPVCSHELYGIFMRAAKFPVEP